MVQLLADALRATAPGPYTFRVVVQPGGLRRAWRNVDEVIDGPKATPAAWLYTAQMAGDGEHLYLHDDCIPMRSWTLPALPCARSIGGGIMGSTIIAWEGQWRPFVAKLAAPRTKPDTAPKWWPEAVRCLAERCQSEVLLNGDFLHLDKSTIHHPSSPYNEDKPALVGEVCRHLVIDRPEPLNAEELAFQRGARPDAVMPLPDEDGGVARKFDIPAVQRAAMPSLATRAANFTSSAARHIAAGAPQASDEEIERRFAICQQCQHFDGTACRKCGCGISRERRFLSKIAWAREKCPAGKW